MNHVDPRRRRSAAHVLVDDLERPVLEDETVHHVARALRLKSGSALTLTDGRGGWRTGTFTGGSEPELDGPAHHLTPPRVAVTVAFTPTKGDRPEWVVQKLTELGVDRIVPLVTARSVVRWDDDRADRQVARWQRIAREALCQSRGVFLPTIEPVTALVDLAAAEPVRVAEPGGVEPDADGIAVAVGPEGGFTLDELALASGTVGLPGGILRAETAAIALAVLLAAARSRREGR